MTALVIQTVIRGPLDGLACALGGCLIGGVLMLPGYVLRLMGAGDVKLMGAVGAFCGAAGAVEVAIATCVIGGIWSLGTMIARRQIGRGLHGTASILMTLIVPMASAAGTPAVMNTGTEDDASQGAHKNTTQNTDQNATRRVAAHSMGTLPYGVAIALGTVFVLFANA
jgi:prepilin peptidase CpaA